MGDSTLRLGVIGVGALALRLLPHLTQEDVVNRVRVTALCDPVLERAEAAGRRYGVAQWFGNVEELLAGGRSMRSASPRRSGCTTSIAGPRSRPASTCTRTRR
jgi:hypothetical protein